MAWGDGGLIRRNEHEYNFGYVEFGIDLRYLSVGGCLIHGLILREQFWAGDKNVD